MTCAGCRRGYFVEDGADGPGVGRCQVCAEEGEYASRSCLVALVALGLAALIATVVR